MEIKNFTITKRDGKKERFSLDKIMNAIIKAFNSVSEPVDLGVVSKILSHLNLSDGVKVEDIQNQVETALMQEGHFKVAKSFIIYRQEHQEDRDTVEKLKFLTDYMSAENAATGSKYDANANVEHKNIATLIGELPKKSLIRLNRRLLTDRIKSMYGKELADEYLDRLNHHFIYKNDETSLAPIVPASRCILVDRRNVKHRRKLHRTHQPEEFLRRVHQYGFHGEQYALGCLCHSGVSDVHELFH